MFDFLPDFLPSIWVALVLVTAFALAFAAPLRKCPLPFYIFFTAAEIAYVWGVTQDNAVLHNILQAFSSCYTGVAMYLVVMFAGAFDKRHRWVKRLMSVRSELSVIGGIIIFGHTILVAFMPLMAITGYWHRIWGDAAGVMFVACVVVGLPLLFCFLMPWITSFKLVRNRMDYRTWKKTQKAAYPFMALLICQGILLSVGHGIYAYEDNAEVSALIGYALNATTYFALGVTYLVLKIRQHAARKARREELAGE